MSLTLVQQQRICFACEATESRVWILNKPRDLVLCHRCYDRILLAKPCVDCGKYINRNARRCRSCMGRGALNPFYAKHHSTEQRQKWREMRRLALPLTDEQILELYSKEKLSINSIADICNVTHKCIRRILLSRRVGLRSRSEAHSVRRLPLLVRKKISRFKRNGVELPEWVWGNRKNITTTKTHREIILEEARRLNQLGMRTLILDGAKVIPDIVAFDGSRLLAVEVQNYKSAKYARYSDERQYDDIIWLTYKKEGGGGLG